MGSLSVGGHVREPGKLDAGHWEGAATAVDGMAWVRIRIAPAGMPATRAATLTVPWAVTTVATPPEIVR